MAKEIFMPKLSSTMEVGTLLQWFKEEGDSIEIGEPLFEIMTDKINIEVEAYDQGVLLKKYFQEDDQVPVNQIIGYIGDKNEQVPENSPGISGGAEAESQSPDEEPVPEKQEVPKEAGAANEGEKVRATPAARKQARMNDVELVFIQGSGPKGRIQKKDVLAHLASSSPKATPLARKVAASEQVPLGDIKGSGVNGKILKSDISTAVNNRTSSSATAEPNRKQMSGMRKVIAKRMSESVNTAPHVTLTTDADMTKVKELRTSLLPVIEKQTGLRLSFTDILIKAAGKALSRHPGVNVSIEGEEIIQHEQVHIGLAVAVEDGLMVPVIKNVNEKGLAQITEDAKEAGKLARENKLHPNQLKGSTFTISNLGMYAVDVFTPIINQPESAILGVGRILDRPVAVEGNLAVRPMITLSLSFDHRAMDGAPAAAFLTELKYILENPFELLV
ncbi:dihydrolipoamide acetyltransferase family protein [Cytobacillus sp. FSL H8-0458]|uniref:dihydrolipoamide acetyltransferase family protein n=1 Tax=Cytobacillus sp. FSL H8-0458 TaxID=2975346 RepID=UPI0030FD1A78